MTPAQKLRHDIAAALYRKRYPEAARDFGQGLPDRVAVCLRQADLLVEAAEAVGARIMMEQEADMEPAMEASPPEVPREEKSPERSPHASSGKRPARRMKALK